MKSFFAFGMFLFRETGETNTLGGNGGRSKESEFLFFEREGVMWFFQSELIETSLLATGFLATRRSLSACRLTLSQRGFGSTGHNFSLGAFASFSSACNLCRRRRTARFLRHSEYKLFFSSLFFIFLPCEFNKP